MDFCIIRIFEGGGKEMKKKSGCPIGDRTRHSPQPVGRPHHWATPAGLRSRSHAPPRRKDYFPRGGEGRAGGEAPWGRAGCMEGLPRYA